MGTGPRCHFQLFATHEGNAWVFILWANGFFQQANLFHLQQAIFTQTKMRCTYTNVVTESSVDYILAPSGVKQDCRQSIGVQLVGE